MGGGIRGYVQSKQGKGAVFNIRIGHEFRGFRRQFNILLPELLSPELIRFFFCSTQ